MKIKALLCFSFMFLSLEYASDVPIIFVHGHKSEAKPYDVDQQGNIIGGFTTWYPMNPNGSLKYQTAM